MIITLSKNGVGKNGDPEQVIKFSPILLDFYLFCTQVFAVGCVYAADDAADMGIFDVHQSAYLTPPPQN
jgi:hypothetical protein